MPEPVEPPLRFAAVQPLRSLGFDDEAVVFDPVSWDAHVLNAAAAAVLELLVESPHSEAEVATFLLEALRPEEQPKAGDHASRLIQELLSLGLVRPADPPSCANC